MGLFDPIITGVPVEYLNHLVKCWNRSLPKNPDLSRKDRYLLCIRSLYENRNLPPSYLNDLLNSCNREFNENTKLGDVLHMLLVKEVRDNFEGFFSPKYEKKVIKKIHQYFIKKKIDPSELGILEIIMIKNGMSPPFLK